MLEIRKFESGATRNSDKDKLNIEGFFHPLVLHRVALYMHKHRFLEDGTIRLGDNWQKGIPKDSAIDSGLRHVLDWWLEHDGYDSRDGIEDALCGVIFNAQSYLLSVLEDKEDIEREKRMQAVQDEVSKENDTKRMTALEVSGYIQNQQNIPEGVYSVAESNPVGNMLKKLGLKK